MPSAFEKFKEQYDQEREAAFAEPKRPSLSDVNRVRENRRSVQEKKQEPPVAVQVKEETKEAERATTFCLPLSTLQALKEIKFKTDMSYKELVVEAVGMLKAKYIDLR